MGGGRRRKGEASPLLLPPPRHTRVKMNVPPPPPPTSPRFFSPPSAPRGRMGGGKGASTHETVSIAALMTILKGQEEAFSTQPILGVTGGGHTCGEDSSVWGSKFGRSKGNHHSNTCPGIRTTNSLNSRWRYWLGRKHKKKREQSLLHAKVAGRSGC